MISGKDCFCFAVNWLQLPSDPTEIDTHIFGERTILNVFDIYISNNTYTASCNSCDETSSDKSAFLKQRQVHINQGYEGEENSVLSLRFCWIIWLVSLFDGLFIHFFSCSPFFKNHLFVTLHFGEGNGVTEENLRRLAM